jgi:hypothetical protein
MEDQDDEQNDKIFVDRKRHSDQHTVEHNTKLRSTNSIRAVPSLSKQQTYLEDDDAKDLRQCRVRENRSWATQLGIAFDNHLFGARERVRRRWDGRFRAMGTMSTSTFLVVSVRV